MLQYVNVIIFTKLCKVTSMFLTISLDIFYSDVVHFSIYQLVINIYLLAKLNVIAFLF